MPEDISTYALLSKRLTGQTLKIFFRTGNTTGPSKVLEMVNVVAFIDNGLSSASTTLILDINTAGSYGTDTAMQLKRPEISHFKEVFLFTDTALTNCLFRGLAAYIEWRSFNEQDDLNY